VNSNELISGFAGTPIQITHLGDGPAVVLVHGTQSAAPAWLDVANHLADRYHCIVMNRRGRAPSGPSGPEYRIETEVADIHALTSHVGADVSLVGHSYGATLALLAALDLPGVRSLVLYEPAWPLTGPVTGPDLNLIARAVQDADLDTALTLIMSKTMHMPAEAIAQLRTTPGWQQQRALAPATLAELQALDALAPTVAPFAKITVPTVILRGGETSPESPFATTADALARTIPNATCVFLPGQEHIAHLIAPAQLAAAITNAM
jgi:pimeloyl-ACP methyl ester carboxylesterase